MKAMENAGGKWYDVEKVPESHIFGVKERPGNEPIPTCHIPIIDLESEEAVHKIIQASKEYGSFQVISHGVSEDVVGETVKVVEEVLGRPADEISEEAKANGWVYVGSTSFAVKGAYFWRDNFKHPCYPFEESKQHWPQNPTRYRQVAGTYIEEMRRLSLRILEAISQGLGLEKGYLGDLSQLQFLSASNYPPCPDPSLTLGVLSHVDQNLITILFQGSVGGLQMLKDGKWMGVEAHPNAFEVNIGTQLQIISNGELKSREHRVVTDPKQGRTSIATFITPKQDCVVQPAKLFLNQQVPYPSHSFKEFAQVSNAYGPSTHALQDVVPHAK